MKDIDNIEFKDIVISVPKNTVGMNIYITCYKDNDFIKLKGDYTLDDIIECEKILDKYIDGELPKYIVTDKGREYLEYLEQNNLI